MHAQLSAPSGPRASPIPRAKNPRCSSVHLAQHPNEPGWSASTRPPPAAPTLVLTRPPVSHCLRAAVRPTAWETPREALHRLVPALTTACCNCLPLVRALVGCCGECSVGQEPFVQVDGSAAELGPALTLQPCLIEREISCKGERHFPEDFLLGSCCCCCWGQRPHQKGCPAPKGSTRSPAQCGDSSGTWGLSSQSGFPMQPPGHAAFPANFLSLFPMNNLNPNQSYP